MRSAAGLQLAARSQLLASSPRRSYPEQLLSVDVCVTKSKGGNATAVDCPSGRNWKLAAGDKCGDKVVLPLGVVSGSSGAHVRPFLCPPAPGVVGGWW